jgi:uncharacterized protein
VVEALASSPVQPPHPRVVSDLTSERGGRPLRIWIDFDNTPHVVFFRPIIAELQRRGHQTFLTARADGQILALAELFGFRCSIVGRGRGTRMVSKVTHTGIRALGLLRVVAQHRPDLAVSHGSRALVLAATAASIPSVTLYDYEEVSAGLFHRLSRKVMVPECIPASILTRRGLRASRLVQYPGIKEQVYLADFTPTRCLREQLGVASSAIMVVLRPESDTAHYRRRDRLPILPLVLRHLNSRPDVVVALMPRSGQQQSELTERLRSLGVKYIVPSVVDGRNLVWAADLVVGGGGTMTREAAALGVPAYSFFQGAEGAVDAHLVKEGRLVLIRSAEDVAQIRLERRMAAESMLSNARDVLETVVDEICATAS